MPLIKPAHLTRWEWMVERFWAGVDKRGENECWPWLKAKVTDGYGTICYEGKIIYATHRLAYNIAHGPIPDGIQILHTCDNPPCCNEKHLILGTNLDNVQDMINKRRGTLKLTEHQIELIRGDLRKQRLIAADFGVDQSLISLIKSGKRWSFMAPAKE